METSGKKLADALRKRRALIADAASRRDAQAHLRKLQDISERIEALAATLPLPVPPMLAHYLERCSYDKALAFLEESDQRE